MYFVIIMFSFLFKRDGPTDNKGLAFNIRSVNPSNLRFHWDQLPNPISQLTIACRKLSEVLDYICAMIVFCHYASKSQNIDSTWFTIMSANITSEMYCRTNN